MVTVLDKAIKRQISVEGADYMVAMAVALNASLTLRPTAVKPASRPAPAGAAAAPAEASGAAKAPAPRKRAAREPQ